MAIESESDLKDFYKVWFEYLIRTPFFHFAKYEDDYVRNNRRCPEKYEVDGEDIYPYFREMLLFLRKYDQWWQYRPLDDWTFDDFWEDNSDFIKKKLNKNPHANINKKTCRFLLPSPGRSWGKAISNNYKTKLNHYVLNTQFSAGQIFLGKMRRVCVLQGKDINLSQNFYKEQLCLPFPAVAGSEKYQKWDINFSTRALLPSENRAKDAGPEFADERGILNKDKVFVKRVFKDVEAGWFPASPL